MKTHEIAEFLQGELVGGGDVEILRVGALENALTVEIAFVSQRHLVGMLFEGFLNLLPSVLLAISGNELNGLYQRGFHLCARTPGGFSAHPVKDYIDYLAFHFLRCCQLGGAQLCRR